MVEKIGEIYREETQIIEYLKEKVKEAKHEFYKWLERKPNLSDYFEEEAQKVLDSWTEEIRKIIEKWFGEEK